MDGSSLEGGLSNGTETSAEYGSHEIWAMSIIASCTVGLTGIVPVLFVPNFHTGDDTDKGKAKLGPAELRLLLSFAVGSLLGNVFLHLLPEAWIQLQRGPYNVETCYVYKSMGAWVLCGLLTFMIVEMIFTSTQQKPVKKPSTTKAQQSKCFHYSKPVIKNGLTQSYLTNGHVKSKNAVVEQPKSLCAIREIHVSGYLNLLANSIDNFTHGLAVAASFTVGVKMGLLTTASILIHEIPHEVGDFAILLKSGFSRWDAAKAQISTATVGVVGAVAALLTESPEEIGERTCWILPFTAGGFLNIALVGILPDIMKEKDPRESVKQFLCICVGIAVMASVNMVAE